MRQPVSINFNQQMLERLADLLTVYVADEAPRLAETYTWTIPARVPIAWFSSSNLNLAEANILLKRALAESWHLDASDRYELANWYVGQWGGIRTNKVATLQAFVVQSEEELARSPITGIATWSKILAMRNPGLYAIFDARVSASLNALQFLASGEPILFPDLVSRNKTVNAFQRWSREERARRQHHRVRKEHVYPSYMAVLHEVNRRLGNECPDHAEMVLFANAETLAMRAMASEAA